MTAARRSGDRFAASQREQLAALLRLLRGGTVELAFDGGTIMAFGDGEGPTCRLRWSDRATTNSLASGTVGFCDGYVAGDWSVERGTLLEILDLLVRSQRHLALKSHAGWKAVAHTALRTARIRLDIEREHRSVRSHYDVGNEFFALWLDAGMTYSCGFARTPSDTLEQMQQQKLDLACEKLQLREGQHLLDLGCGWGSLALHAARERGVRVTAVNVSGEQLRYVRERVAQARIGDRVSVVESDYRAVAGAFDAVAAVGLAEHAGRRGVADLFDSCARVAREGAPILVHTIADAAGSGMDPWLERRVFPGANVVGLADLSKAAERAGLRVCHVENIGTHYALTLRHWLGRFLAASETIDQRYGPAFRRSWEMYLSMLIPTFEHLSTCVFQVVATKGPGASARRNGFTSLSAGPGR